MHITSVSALAVLAFAASATAAEPKPYKPLMKMSIHQMFGIGRRQDNSAYQPTQSICGTGTTCAEACGDGYETCTSSDEMVHCYNPAAAQTCCPDASGNSCDAGYYCSADSAGETYCCPEGMDTEACAAAYKITGGLTSEIPVPTTSAYPTSTYEPITTTSSSYPVYNTSSAVETSTYPAGTGYPTATYPASNNTATYTQAPSPTQTEISGANVAGPAGVLALIAAAGVAALL